MGNPHHLVFGARDGGDEAPSPSRIRSELGEVATRGTLTLSSLERGRGGGDAGNPHPLAFGAREGRWRRGALTLLRLERGRGWQRETLTISRLKRAKGSVAREDMLASKNEREKRTDVLKSQDSTLNRACRYHVKHARVWGEGAGMPVGGGKVVSGNPVRSHFGIVMPKSLLAEECRC